MTNILLHVGTYKTGSTTIQQTLFRNRDILAHHDIHYLSIAPTHGKFCASFMTKPWEFRQYKLEGWTKEQVLEKSRHIRKTVETELQNTQCNWFIISAEAFSGLRSELITDTIDWLRSFGDVHVVYFVRWIASYQASQSQQAAKVGLETNTAPYQKALDRLIKFPRNWRDIVGPERFTLYRFEDAVQNGLTNTLLGSAGLPCIEAMGIKEHRTNESISAPATECLYELNRVAPVGSQERNASLYNLLRNLPGDKYRAPNLTESQIEDYNKQMHDLHQLCGIEPYSPLTYEGENDNRQPFSSEAIGQLVEAMNQSFNEVDRLKAELEQDVPGKRPKRARTLKQESATDRDRHLIERFKNFVRRHPPLMRLANFVRGR